MKKADIKRLLSDAAIYGNLTPPISRLTFSSAQVNPGDTFVAIRGHRVDGHEYITQAIAKGASSVLCEETPSRMDPGITYIVVPDSAKAMGIVAHALNDSPSAQLVVVGITGTNGKTTTATALYHLFNSLGYRSGLLSTIRNVVAGEIIPSSHTTGDSLQISSLMARMVAAGCTHCFMEVTSHALAQQRVSGVVFDAGVFTNFSQDHLDFHGTMEAYFAAKKDFFDHLPAEAVAVVNCDDDKAEDIVADTPARVVRTGRRPEADYRLAEVRSTSSGLEFQINRNQVRSPMVGQFNASNLAGVVAVACELGLGLDDVIAALAALMPVEGRMQAVSAGRLKGVVDFAHTPDALKTILETVREIEGVRQVILVFGCGGDRDREKRPLMGRIATSLADTVIITSDNPRSEDPLLIIDEIVAGIPSDDLAKVHIEPDRASAIARACGWAGEGAIVLVAGKGHERFQETAGEKRPFDDSYELLSQLQAAADARPSRR